MRESLKSCAKILNCQFIASLTVISAALISSIHSYLSNYATILAEESSYLYLLCLNGLRKGGNVQLLSEKCVTATTHMLEE
jgi:hypothetical protein